MAERAKAKPGATSTKAAKPTATAAKNKAASARAAKTEGEGKSMAKPAATKTNARGAVKERSSADTERIRTALQARRGELHEEYEQHMAEIAELQRDRLTDSAGDDQADTGTKTFEREQEISLANSILERITQVERALERLDEGSYGWCERCGDAIPVERLAAFPSATLCVRCKQLEERR